MTARNWRAAIWVSGLIAASAAAPWAAQAQAGQQCASSTVLLQRIDDIPAELRPRHPIAFYDRIKPLLTDDRFADAVADLEQVFKENDDLGPTDPGRQAIERRLASLRRLFTFSVDRAAYTIRSNTPGEEPALLDILPNPTTGNFELFPEDADRIVVNDATPEEDRRAICWTVISAQRILADFRAPAIVEAVRIMERTRQEWQNYSGRGYSSYPWESLLFHVPPFRRCVETNLGPPTCAAILLHPNAGMELSRLGTPTD